MGERSIADELDYETGRFFDRLYSGQGSCTTLGELSQRRAPKRESKADERHAVPRGCEWARDCERCPWPDCVIPSGARCLVYDSEEAQRMRAKYIADLRRAGMSIQQVADRLGIAPSSVKRYDHLEGATPAGVKSVIEATAVRRDRRDMAILLAVEEEGSSVTELRRGFRVGHDSTLSVMRLAGSVLRGPRAWVKRTRNVAIVRLAAEGTSIRDLAVQMNLSERTVHRVLVKYREECVRHAISKEVE